MATNYIFTSFVSGAILDVKTRLKRCTGCTVQFQIRTGTCDMNDSGSIELLISNNIHFDT